MHDISIYHNPRCSKSRQALALLHAAGIEPQIILYIDDVPSEAELRGVLAKLGLSAVDLLRKGEEAYKAHFTGITDEETLVSLLCAHPKVIERPIIIKGNKAVIGRPPEAVAELIENN